jgi:hypothetical protein
MRARGLRPRGVRARLTVTSHAMLPSAYSDGVGTPDGLGLAPKGLFFRGSIPGPQLPLSTLRPCPREQRRMTRGQCGWLLLHCSGLSPCHLAGFAGAPESNSGFRVCSAPGVR